MAVNFVLGLRFVSQQSRFASQFVVAVNASVCLLSWTVSHELVWGGCSLVPPFFLAHGAPCRLAAASRIHFGPTKRFSGGTNQRVEGVQSSFASALHVAGSFSIRIPQPRSSWSFADTFQSHSDGFSFPVLPFSF